MAWLKRLFKKEEGVELAPSPHVLPSATTTVVVGDKGVGKSTLVARLAEGRKTKVFSPLESWRGAEKKLRTPKPGETEVLIIDDLPAYGRGAEEVLAQIAALQRHLGIRDMFIVTQILESVPSSVFKQAEVLIVFKCSLNVNKLAHYINDYKLAQRLAAMAEGLNEYECVLVNLRKKVVSRVFNNTEVEDIRQWLENPAPHVSVEEVEVEEVEVIASRYSIRQQVLRLKKQNPSLTHYEISKMLGISINHAKKELSRLRRAGLID